MKILFLLQAILTLGIFSFLSLKIFFTKDKNETRIMKGFLAAAAAYLIISISSFLWFFKILEYSAGDYLIIWNFLLLIKNIVFFRLVYSFFKNKKLYYFLGLYLFAIPFLILLSNHFWVLSLILSYLFSLLLFLDFASREGVYKKIGYFGIMHSLLAIISSSFFFFNLKNIYLFSFVSSLFFFALIYYFIYNLKLFNVSFPVSEKRERPHFFKLISHLVFIIAIVNLVFIGTIGIHEFGHFSVAKMEGCEYGKIVYDGSLFHTEAICSNKKISSYVTLGGILLPIFVAIFLLLVGGRFIYEIALLMIGFNLIAISRDLAEFSLSQNLIFASIFIGIAFLIFGIFKLAKSKIDVEIYESSFSKKTQSPDFFDEEIKFKRIADKVLSRKQGVFRLFMGKSKRVKKCLKGGKK